MVGVALAVVTVALVVGFLGRLAMPGRRGLLTLLCTDPRFARRFVAHDVELRWELGGAALGAVFGYIGGRLLEGFGASAGSFPWTTCLVGAVVLTGIAIVSGVIERSRFTRKLGIHQKLGGVHA